MNEIAKQYLNTTIYKGPSHKPQLELKRLALGRHLQDSRTDININHNLTTVMVTLSENNYINK